MNYYNDNTTNKMKINSRTTDETNALLFKVFSKIPLDVEGSNIDFVGWIPSEDDKKYMPNDVYESEKKKGEEQKEKVLFRNLKTQWESCDCGGGYPCSHGSYVYAIDVINDDKTHELSLEPEYIGFDNNGQYGCLPIPGATIFDFIRMCQLCDIELELSDYALSLIEQKK